MGALKNIALAIGGAAAGYTAASIAADRRALESNLGLAKGKRILIIGAGFGGQAVAHELIQLLPGDDNGDITVVDEDNFLLFTPMLTEAAGGELDPRHIAVPTRHFPRRVKFVQATVKSIDLQNKTVTVQLGSDGLVPREQQLSADHIVVALGSVTNYHHVPGVAEHSLGVKQLGDARAVCDRVLSCLQRVSTAQSRDQRQALLTFVVAGGGYTGVETMAAVNDLVREQAATYGQELVGDVRTVLVNPSDRLLSETSQELGDYAAGKLRERGVDILLNASVKSASASDVELSNGERIPTYTFIWAAGVKPSPVVSNLDCEKGKHGGIKTSPACTVPAHAGIWAIGDCAEIPNPAGGTYAPTAQNATREGALVARNIVRMLKGASPRPFTYKPIGQLALVGKHSGVARIGGVNISGFCAWAMWRAVYVAKMPSAAQRARVLMDWTMDLLFGRDPLPSESGATEGNTAAAQV